MNTGSELPPLDESASTSRIYLDYAATTPLRDEVRQAMASYDDAGFGNPSSLHQEGRQAREALESAREEIRRQLGAADFILAFTGGGTEADNAAILGPLLARLGAGRTLPGDLHVVASTVEHPAVLGALDLAGQWGIPHTLVPVDASGRVRTATVLEALRPETALVSIMAANNEVGTLQPIRELGIQLRQRGIPFHSDAIQLLGKGPLDLAEVPVDIVSLSAHKVSGPRGVGAVLVRRELDFESVLRGGSQEDGLRAGTEAVSGAVGFARAVDLAVTEQPGESARLRRLVQRLREGLESRLEGVRVNTPVEGSSPHILNVSFDRVEGESLLKLLDHGGVAVSTASACNVGARKPSHVLEAMGLDARQVRGSIRFSTGRMNTSDEIERALTVVTAAVQRLRAIAP